MRNILNFTNIIRIFQGNSDIVNAVEYTADSTIANGSLANEAGQNGAFDDETGDDRPHRRGAAGAAPG